jgi:hypothetical protein
MKEKIFDSLFLVFLLVASVLLFMYSDKIKNKALPQTPNIKIGQKADILSGFYEKCEAVFNAWTRGDDNKEYYHVIVSCPAKEGQEIIKRFYHVPMKLTEKEAKELVLNGKIQ